MITQYTRLVVNDATGEIDHCTSQDFPFADGWEPVDDRKQATTNYDFEIDADYPDLDFKTGGAGQQLIRGRQIIDNFEVVNGVPQLKAGADVAVSGKVLRVSAAKSIQESDIKIELAGEIRTRLESGGASEKQLLDGIRKIDLTAPDKLVNLKTVQLIRTKKALSA